MNQTKQKMTSRVGEKRVYIHSRSEVQSKLAEHSITLGHHIPNTGQFTLPDSLVLNKVEPDLPLLGCIGVQDSSTSERFVILLAISSSIGI